MWCDQLVSGAFSPTPSHRSVWGPMFEDGLMSEGHKSWRTESVRCICFLLKYSRLYIKNWCRRCDITHGLAVLKPDVTCWGGIRLRHLVSAHWQCSHGLNRHRSCDVTFVVRYTEAFVVLCTFWWQKNIRNKWKKTRSSEQVLKKKKNRHRSRNVKMRLWILSTAEENLSCYKPRSEQTRLKKAFGFSERLSRA